MHITVCCSILYGIDSFSVNSHLIQNRLKIDVMLITAYASYTHLLARATIAQWL